MISSVFGCWVAVPTEPQLCLVCTTDCCFESISPRPPTFAAAPAMTPNSSYFFSLSFLFLFYNCPDHERHSCLSKLDSAFCVQVPDWHPGNGAANQELLNQDTWQNNMINFFSKLVTTYPGVVGKLVLDLVNVSLLYTCSLLLLYVLLLSACSCRTLSM